MQQPPFITKQDTVWPIKPHPFLSLIWSTHLLMVSTVPPATAAGSTMPVFGARVEHTGISSVNDKQLQGFLHLRKSRRTGDVFRTCRGVILAQYNGKRLACSEQFYLWRVCVTWCPTVEGLCHMVSHFGRFLSHGVPLWWVLGHMDKSCSRV